VIYLDNAATTFPKPPGVIGAVNRCLKNYSANPGRSSHKLSQRAAEEVYTCRQKLCDFFGADTPEGVIFTANCTTAVNILLKGVLTAGDHVICSSYEHNAVVRPLSKLKTLGVEYDVAGVYSDEPSSVVSSFEALIKDNTKMIICVHASNVNGVVLPIKEIGEMAHSHGLLFAVDAAQSAGVLEINMKSMNIDYLFVAPHKGLYSPMGVGVLLADNEIGDTLIEGGTGSLSSSMLQPDFYPDRFESGTVNLPAICGISSGLDFVNAKGIRNIYHHEHKLVSRLYKLLTKTHGVKVYNAEFEIGKTVPVLSFNIDGYSSEEVGELLNKSGIAIRSGLHCAPLAHKTIGTINIGTARVCPSIYTTEREIDALFYRIKLLIKS